MPDEVRLATERALAPILEAYDGYQWINIAVAPLRNDESVHWEVTLGWYNGPLDSAASRLVVVYGEGWPPTSWEEK